MHINKYCFSSKTVIKHLSVKRPRGRFMCGSRIFDRGWRGGGGGGPYPTFSKSSTYLTVVHQWFISGPTFSRGGGGKDGGGWSKC